MIIELYDKRYIQHFTCNGCKKRKHQSRLKRVQSADSPNPFGWVFVCDKCREVK